MKYLNNVMCLCLIIIGITSISIFAACDDYKINSDNYKIRQEYIGEIGIMAKFEKEGKPGFRFDEKISIGIKEYNTVDKILSLIKKSEKILSITIGIKVEKNVPTNRIHSLTVECYGDKLFKNIYVLILSSEIEGEKTNKIVNEYKFTDKKVIKKNYSKVLNERVKRVFQYQESKKLKPAPVPDAKENGE